MELPEYSVLPPTVKLENVGQDSILARSEKMGCSRLSSQTPETTTGIEKTETGNVLFQTGSTTASAISKTTETRTTETTPDAATTSTSEATAI